MNKENKLHVIIVNPPTKEQAEETIKKVSKLLSNIKKEEKIWVKRVLMNYMILI